MTTVEIVCWSGMLTVSFISGHLCYRMAYREGRRRGYEAGCVDTWRRALSHTTGVYKNRPSSTLGGPQ